MSYKQEPFFIATYIPKNGYPNHPGMLQLLPYMNEVWKNKRDDISSVTSQVNDFVTGLDRQKNDAEANPFLIEQTVRELSKRFDSKNGGFSNAPKFPTPHLMLFLLRQSLDSSDQKKLQEMVQKNTGSSL